MESRSVTNMNPIDPHPLASLMEKARRDAFFLGYALSDFAQRKNLDDKALANHLRCPVERLPQLFLCRCPDGDDQNFAQDIRIIAEYAPCDEDQLLRALREVAALAKLSKPSPGKGRPTLLAARDRHESDDQPEEPGDSQSPTEAP